MVRGQSRRWSWCNCGVHSQIETTPLAKMLAGPTKVAPVEGWVQPAITERSPADLDLVLPSSSGACRIDRAIVGLRK